MTDSTIPAPARVATPEEAFLKHLRAATADVHDRLEATPVARALMGQTLDLDGYRLWLAANLGVVEPLEHSLLPSPFWRRLGIDPRTRLKSPALEADLRELGADPDAVPRLAELPCLCDDAEALGAAYVMEGATLGGQVIARQLAAQFGFGPERGARFFHVYGEEVGPRWREFRQGLAAYAVGRGAEAAVVEGARKGFAAFESAYAAAFAAWDEGRREEGRRGEGRRG